MPQEKTDSEKLQECSELVSYLIRLDKAYQKQTVDVVGAQLAIPDELIKELKQLFRESRVKLITTVNSIHQ